MIKKILASIVIGISLICSCSKQTEFNNYNSEYAHISFSYSLEEMQAGNPIVLDMPAEMLTQLTDKDYKMIHDTYYSPIKDGVLSGELINKLFYIYLTEETTGEIYRFEDYFNTNNIFLVKPGKYKVSGKNSISSWNDKCRFILDEEIVINSTDTKVLLKPKYDCILLISEDETNNLNVLRVLNDYIETYYYRYNKWHNYYFSFLCDSGEYSYNGNNLERGKYYIVPSIKTETTPQTNI